LEKGFSREKGKEKRLKEKGKRGRAREEEKLEANGIAGFTQVRGVYHRLMGLMG